MRASSLTDAVPWALTFPALAYALYLGLANAGPASVWEILGLGLSTLPAGALARPSAAAVCWASWGAGVGASALLALGGGFEPSAGGTNLLGAMLLGLPVPATVALLSLRARPPAFLAVLAAGLLDLVGVAASGAYLPPGGASGPAGLASGFLGANLSELSGLGALVQGGRTASLPLQSLADPIVDLVLLLAVTGGFFAVAPGAGLAATGGGRARPIVIGGAAAIGFELAAATAPELALLALGAGVLATLAALIVLARPPGMPAVRASAAAEPRGPAGPVSR